MDTGNDNIQYNMPRPNQSVDQEFPSYKQNWNNQPFRSHSYTRDQYYNLENVSSENNFSCDVCNKSFFTHGQYKKHVDGHIECPFPECNLKADMKAIDRHIDHQHMLINFQDLQIDDETWITERKKRFPTIQRAELRRTQQIERLKRGERLGKDKKKFATNKGKWKFAKEDKQEGNNESKEKWKMKKFGKDDKQEARNENKEKWKRKKFGEDDEQEVSNDNKEKWKMKKFAKDDKQEASNENKEKWKRKKFGKDDEQEVGNENKEKWKRKKFGGQDRPFRPWSPILLEDPYDSDDDNKLGVPAFKGTKAFFENTGELSLFGLKLSEDTISTNSDINISDEEDWNTPTNENTDDKIILQNALGTLMGAYESGSDLESGMPTSEPPCNLPVVCDGHIKPHQTSNCDPQVEGMSSNLNENCNKRKRRWNRSHRKGNNAQTGNLGVNQKGQINESKLHQNKKRRRPTLLQKLLKPNIIHERNVILQCIRYIVNNNYLVVSNDKTDDSCMDNS